MTQARATKSTGADEAASAGPGRAGMGSGIFESALDCIFTMDADGDVLDINPAAEATFGYRREKVRGRRLAELIIPEEFHAAHERALRRYVETGQPTMLDRRLELSAKTSDGRPLPVELTITRLGTQDPPIFAGFIRDLTQRRLADERIAQLLAREQAARIAAEVAERSSRRISEALQRSLLPPHLAPVPGIEVAAAYEPSDDRLVVGGDFYDVFPISEERWGVVVGDVSGKGADAASLTALVRYTLRAAAVRESRPGALLEIVNDALVREPRDNAYCTLAYVSLRIEDAGPQLEIAIAGHPLPLVLRRGGDVETAGRPGPILGATADASFPAEAMSLGEGEIVLLYTDGVTETRTPSGLFGLEGLRHLVRRCPDHSPDALVTCVAKGIREGTGHRVTDDVALLALRAVSRGRG